MHADIQTDKGVAASRTLSGDDVAGHDGLVRERLANLAHMLDEQLGVSCSTTVNSNC